MKNKLIHLLTLAMLFLAPTVWGGDFAFYANVFRKTPWDKLDGM